MLSNKLLELDACICWSAKNSGSAKLKFGTAMWRMQYNTQEDKAVNLNNG